MAADAKQKNLLYVSSNADNGEYVYVYSYPGGDQEGMLAGLSEPEGECVDKAADVFITNYYGAHITEYAHGGTEPVATLQEPYSYPDDCSIDPMTGNLAVTNDTGSRGYGDIAIYKHAEGEPHYYSDTKIITLIGHCAYDDEGNLFFDGADAQLNFTLVEVTRGSTIFRAVSFPRVKKRYGLGPLQWDGKYIAIGNTDDNMVYQLSISQGKAQIVGSTSLTDAWALEGFSIPKLASGKRHPQGTKIVGPNYNGGNVKIWDYPAGGTSIRTIEGASVPVGTAISPAEK
jgi:hypothetical protein